MKIAIEAQRLFRKKKHGMDLVALELIRHLQQIDQENEYYILVQPDEDNQCLTETSNFHIIEVPSGLYPIWEQYHLTKIVKKICPDILHCTSNTAPLNIKIPLILTLHDILYMQKIDFTKGTWYQRMGNLYRRFIVPRIINNCKKIITVSDFEKRHIDKYFKLETDKVTTVYNACSQRFYESTDFEMLQLYKDKYHLPDKYILYLGNTHPNKNLRNVLKALSLFNKKNEKKIPLVMPDVEEKFLNNILQEIKDKDLRSFIHLTGYIPNPELTYIYKLAAVFLYPSFYESFGIPILEAMACGVPVITSNRAAMIEVAGSAAHLINPENPEEIADAMQNLFEDPKLYSTYKDAGQRRASDFNWKITAQKMLEIYEEVSHQTLSLIPSRKSI